MISFGQRLAAVVATSLLLLSVVAASPVAAQAAELESQGRARLRQAGAGPGALQCHRSVVLCRRAGIRDPDQVVAQGHAAAAAQSIYFDGTSIRTAYGMTGVGDPSLVVAIVDAYDDPNAFANVTRFRSDSRLAGAPELHAGHPDDPDELGEQPLLHQDQPDRRHLAAVAPTPAGRTRSTWTCRPPRPSARCAASCFSKRPRPRSATSRPPSRPRRTPRTSWRSRTATASRAITRAASPRPTTTPPRRASRSRPRPVMTATASCSRRRRRMSSAVGGTTLAIDLRWRPDRGDRLGGHGQRLLRYNAAPAWQSIPGNPCAGKKAISDLSADRRPELRPRDLHDLQQHHRVLGLRRHEPVLADHRGPLRAAGRLQRVHARGPSTRGRQARRTTTSPPARTRPGRAARRCCAHAGVGWDGPTGRGSIASAPSAPPRPDLDHRLARRTPPSRRARRSSSAPPARTSSVSRSAWADVHVVGDRRRHHRASGLVLPATTAGGPFTVTATSGGVSGTAERHRDGTCPS